MLATQLSLWDAPVTAQTPLPPLKSFHVRSVNSLEDRHQHLSVSLHFAVPLEILHIQRHWGKPTLAMIDQAKAIVPKLCGPGAEDLMFADQRSKKGRAAAIFADLVWALAILAFCPYGVRYGDGGRWIAEPKPSPYRIYEHHCSVCGMLLAEEPDDLPNDPYACCEFDCPCERFYCRQHWQEHYATYANQQEAA